ncbi:hypothetical protein EBZ35_09015 [bacterium]|nr:hypothetical protein [bacterium]
MKGYRPFQGIPTTLFSYPIFPTRERHPYAPLRLNVSPSLLNAPPTTNHRKKQIVYLIDVT